MFGAWSIAYKSALEKPLAKQSTALLSILLLVLAAILVLIALMPGHPLLKAGTILWVTLP